MAIETQNRYSELIAKKLENTLALKDGVVFNNNYEGDVKAGAVKIAKTNKATVVDYDKSAGADFSDVTLAWETVIIDKDVAVNEIVDGYDAEAVPVKIVANRLNEAGKALATKIDVDGADKLVKEGTKLEDTTALTKSNVYEKFVDARTAMSEAGVPNDNRYALVSPKTYATCLKSPEFVNASNLSDEIRSTGAIGAIAGFALYESNNLGKGVEVVYGHPDFATRVKEFRIEPQLVNLVGKHIGASAIQGRYVYTHKVTEPKAILVKTDSTYVAPATTPDESAT